jgi:hypothetical protein
VFTFHILNFLVILGTLGCFFFIPYTHESSVSQSGPYPSHTSWYTPIATLIASDTTSTQVLSWSIYNPAVMQLVNIVMLLALSFYWQRIRLFTEYITEKEKVSIILV